MNKKNNASGHVVGDDATVDIPELIASANRDCDAVVDPADTPERAGLQFVPGVGAVADLKADLDEAFDATGSNGLIRQGYRGSTLANLASKTLLRFGNSSAAKHVFLRETGKCVPPLNSVEAESIWEAAVDYYLSVTVKQPGYVEPDTFALALADAAGLLEQTSTSVDDAHAFDASNEIPAVVLANATARASSGPATPTGALAPALAGSDPNGHAGGNAQPPVSSGPSASAAGGNTPASTGGSSPSGSAPGGPSGGGNSPAATSQDDDLKPGDSTDVGQAAVLANLWASALRYSEGTGWLGYDGISWRESDVFAQRLAQHLTQKQLVKAEAELETAKQVLEKLGILSKINNKTAVANFNPTEKLAYEDYLEAKSFRDHVKKCRSTRGISAALKEARPMLHVEPSALDADPFLLNTPSNTYNLKTGLAQPHSPDDLITKCTTVDPSDIGADIWQDTLDKFFCGNSELIEYVQQLVGLAAIGRVFVEALIIAYGEGKNGKSTFWNTIARVLGTYSGNLSAEVLTVNNRSNVQPELAELRGKRLVIAAELEEGQRLNTARVKHLCSTDQIYAAAKYRQPFAFTPTHSAVLYTNHLPKVGAIDAGTWRRLLLLPFGATISASADIKNYADYLFENAGGAVLQWIIDGAQRVIASDFQLVQPAVVQNAITNYRNANDWLSAFLEEKCEVDVTFTEASGIFYTSYRNYCAEIGEYARNKADFYAALDAAGFSRRKTNRGSIINGLRLHNDCCSGTPGSGYAA